MIFIHIAKLLDVPYCDAFPNARAGWLDRLDEHMTAPDALGYWPPPEHLQLNARPTPEAGGEVENTTCDQNNNKSLPHTDD